MDRRLLILLDRLLNATSSNPLKKKEEQLTKANEDLLQAVNSSNELFEKQLSYISGGALALSFIVIEKVLKDFSKTTWKGLLVAGWSCLLLLWF